MTMSEILKKKMTTRLEDGQKVDPRLLDRLDDGGPVGAGTERVSAIERPAKRRRVAAR